jgi:hypothetical protein
MVVEQQIFRHRFIIILPCLDNDGKPIDREKIEQALDEIQNKFRGYTTSSNTSYPNWFGYWKSESGEEYFDYNFMIMVDVNNHRGYGDAEKFFKYFRSKYMKIFNQEEVYIITHPITKIE